MDIFFEIKSNRFGASDTQELLQKNMVKNFQPTKQEVKLAEDLYDEFLAYTEDFHDGDGYELMAYYMQEMDLEYLFEIREE